MKVIKTTHQLKCDLCGYITDTRAKDEDTCLNLIAKKVFIELDHGKKDTKHVCRVCADKIANQIPD